ncbi:MAG: hypothetical protein V4508_17680 [Pseudomonadota bacterium]
MALTRLNFCAHGAPLRGWRLALLVAGLLALAASGLQWIVQARASARLEAQLAQAQPRTVLRAPFSATLQREQDQQLKLVADAVRQLNLPVTRLIRTVQAPQDIRVALLGLDLGASASLKLSAEAETAQDMMNYLAFLDEQPLFVSVYLVKHELGMGSSAAERPYRFQLEAQWRE